MSASPPPPSPVKRINLERTPEPLFICEQFETSKLKRAMFQHRAKPVLKRLGGDGRNLVLNGNMQPQRLRILRCRQAMHAILNDAMQIDHFRTLISDSSAPGQLHQAADPGLRRRMPGQFAQQLSQFGANRRRQAMKQGYVRLEPVAFGREMSTAEPVCPVKNVRRQLRRYKQRHYRAMCRPGQSSPRALRIVNHFSTLALCCSSVSAKAWPPVPSATI